MIMTEQDWFVKDNGQCFPCEIEFNQTELSHPYRLYRFLTELEDILNSITDDYLRLKAIRPLVRKLLTTTDWIQILALDLDPHNSWEVLTLYNEPSFPLTVQLVAWAPNMTSPIHNHGCWAMVALLSGEEKNTFWQRTPTLELPDQIKPVETRVLYPGDILSMTANTIHHVEVTGNEPTISFNLYGHTNYQQRFEFDPLNCTAKNF